MVRDEARERVRWVEGREISQVTGKGNLLKGFPQGSPVKASAGCCVENRMKEVRTEDRDLRVRSRWKTSPTGKPGCSTRHGTCSGSRNWLVPRGRRPQGARRIQVARAPRGGGKAEPASCAHPLCSSGLPGKLPRHISGEEQRPGTACTGGPCSGRPPTAFSGKQVTHEESCQPKPDDKQAQAQRQQGWGDPALSAPFRGKK